MNIQSKVYDLLEYNIKHDKVPNLEYKLKEQSIFHIPDKSIINERRFTANINKWLSEINYSIGVIVEELLYLLAYQEIYNSNKTISKYVFTSKERYLKLVVYDLFSMREKLAHLIYELFNRQIDLSYGKRKLSLSFNNILKIIDTVTLNDINWISNDEFELIKNILNNNFNTEKSKYIFKYIRHPFTHRNNPGMGCLPLLSFEFPYVDDSIQKMNESLDRKLGKNTERKRYRIISSKPKEKQFNNNEVIEDILGVWNLFIDGFKILFNNIHLLKVEIIKLQ